MAGPDFADVRGAIFDMDGTLLDSMSIWETIGADYLRFCGIEPRPDLRERIRNMSLPQAARYYQSAYGLRKSEEEILAGVNGMLARFYREQAALKPGTAGLLESLARRGVERVGIRSRFECIFTCSESGGKDAPHIYEAALRRLGTPREQTWVFEDALYAVRTALAAGFPVVGVFDRHERDTAQVARLSNLYVKNLAELEAYFH